MTYTAELTIEDHKDFLRLLGGRMTGPLGLLISLVSLGLVLFCVYGAGLFLVVLGESWQSGALDVILATPSLMVAVVTGLLLLPVVFLLLRWALRNLLGAARGLKVDAIDESSLRDGLNVGAYQFELVADGVRVAHPLEESLYTWSAFQGLRETDDTLFLMLDPKSAIIIPKRAFSDAEAVEAFKARVESEIEACP